ncbi:MAG: hypothetical protein IJ848_02830 [Alphaproteobacteria bacterium]|nr:hypothetical protein [Alphaproteobacteria bacterium]
MFYIISKFAIIKLFSFLFGLGILSNLLFDILKRSFLYNVYINSVIVFSFVFGIITCIIKIFSYEVEYSKLLQIDKLHKRDINSLKILKPLFLYVRPNSKIISNTKLQIVLSDIEKKVDESEQIPKYIAGILIFLGLFGTFWGLSRTIGNVSSILDNLGMEQGDASLSFVKLKDSLKIPLEGMGIAFGCSLFGLLGSLILGVFNLQQKKIANRFLDKVEEWLMKYSVNINAIEQNTEYHGQLFSMGLLEKTIETIYAFQHQLHDLDENRVSLYNMQREVNKSIEDLSTSLLKHQEIIRMLGEHQLELQKAVAKVSNQFSDSIGNELTDKLSLIDNSINKLMQSNLSNRDYVVNNLGADIKLVSKTLSALIRD